MRKKQFTQGITIFTTPEMYSAIKKASDETEVSISEFFRNVVAWYLSMNGRSE